MTQPLEDNLDTAQNRAPANRPLPPAAQMPPPSSPLHPQMPKGACDTHVHLVTSAGEYPLWEGRTENPANNGDGKPDFDGWLDLYRAHLKALGATRGIIVHSILYGTNNDITVEAVRRLGPDFKGVGLLPDNAPTTDIAAFARAGMVAVRLNYVHGGVLSWQGACDMAPKLADNQLHIQMLLHTHQHINDLAATITHLPVDVVIDHIGWPDITAGVNEAGFQTLLRLLDSGKIWVKLSALYRLCPPPYTQLRPFVDALI